MQTHDPAVPITKKSFLPAGIVKRDGQRVAFDPRRIAVALTRAGLASGEFDDDEAELLTQRVLKVLRHRFAASDPTVEQVQDIVEQVLVEATTCARSVPTSPTATSIVACARIARR